jgi:hypothetical protein
MCCRMPEEPISSVFLLGAMLRRITPYRRFLEPICPESCPERVGRFGVMP